MKNITKILVFLSLIITSNAVMAIAEGFAQKRLLPKQFSIYGRAYFNVTDSAVQGEQYLLNQQFTNLKLYGDWRLTDAVDIHGLLIYNAAPTPINATLYFDELFVSLKQPKAGPWQIKLGKQWVPFGQYKNDLIYKSLSKALGQTNEIALVFGTRDEYYVNVALFSPHSKMMSSRLPFQYVLNLGWSGVKHQLTYDIGLSHAYSIAETQLFQYNKGVGGFLYHSVHSHVPGLAGYVNLQYGQFNTNLSHVLAEKRFNQDELAFQGKGARPAAFSIQQGYRSYIFGMPIQAILFYDYSFDALPLRLPKERAGVGLNIFPNQYLDLQFQYARDQSYAATKSASGLNTTIYGNGKATNTFVLQLVVRF